MYSENEQYDENEYYGDYLRYAGVREGEVDALEVLSLYSAEPDWSMDAGLRLSPLQALTGGSQGYRHLRFHLFGLRAGSVISRACYYHDIAGRVLREGDRYWALRYWARAIHYIEDSLTPVHQKPFTEGFFLRNILRLRDMQTMTSNYHLNYERIIGCRLWHGEERLIGAVEEAAPLRIVNLERDLRRASRKARRLCYPLFRELEALWPLPEFRRPFKIGGSEAAGLRLSETLVVHTRSWLALSASFIKGYIGQYVLPFFRED